MLLLLLYECRGKPWVGPWKKGCKYSFWLIQSSKSTLSLHIFIHFAFQHLCSLASVQAFLKGMRLFFRLHVILSLFFPRLLSLTYLFLRSCTCWILMLMTNTHTHIDTHSGWNCFFSSLHKHFHSKEDSSDVWAQWAEAALSRIQRSVWTAEGFPWEDPRGARRDAAPLKTWLSLNSLHMSRYITDLSLSLSFGMTSQHACRSMMGGWNNHPNTRFSHVLAYLLDNSGHIQETSSLIYEFCESTVGAACWDLPGKSMKWGKSDLKWSRTSTTSIALSFRNTIKQSLLLCKSTTNLL